MTRPLYRELAETIDAFKRCSASPFNSSEPNPWLDKWQEYITLLSNHLPSAGSGIDGGTHLALESCTPAKLVFHTSYHHMDNGSYDGWTEHTVTVRPAFAGIKLAFSGPNRNDIKEYLHDVYHTALTADVSLTWYRFHFGDLVPKIVSRWLDPCTQEFSVQTPVGGCAGRLVDCERTLLDYCQVYEDRLCAQLRGSK